jgi:hypothetical protein
MVKEFGNGASLETYDQFLTWIVCDSADEAKYNNLVEVFLWFCMEIEKAKPQFFD